MSLIKETGSEGRLAQMFKKVMSAEPNPNLIFIEFDLHKIVGHTKFQNLKQLWDQTNPSVEAHGFYFKQFDKDEYQLQKGVMRTNCKDNLDRTNLVMTGFAQQSIWKQLEKHGIKGEAISPEEKKQVEQVINILWADNGDAVSLQYAGTPAMRSDFTRTGVLTFRGQINDAMNSAYRYYLNNFIDGSYQDSIDLFLQTRQGSLPKSYSPEFKNPPKGNSILLYIAKLFVLLFTRFQPTSGDGINFIYVCFWTFLVFIVWKVFRFDHRLIVSQPILKTNEVKIGRQQGGAGAATQIGGQAQSVLVDPPKPKTD